jgi:AcrR family transcriptional regulator
MNGYHHGDLHQALIDAAREIVQSDGAAAVTIRQVARAVGVSHAAPYHHFGDKSALLAAVAEDGFRRLASGLGAVEAEFADPSLRLREAGVAYVVFAVRNPELFRLMFSRETAEAAKSETPRTATQETRGYLERALASYGPFGGDDALRACWAMVHGLATLIISGQFGDGAMRPEAAAEISRQALDSIWQGLAPSG